MSANFRGPEFPQGFFGIQSMMDDVAAKLKMDPVEFILKNMTRKAGDETPYTELLARRVHPPRRRGVRVEEALEAAAGIRSPARSSAAPACRSWRSAPASAAAAPSSASTRKGKYTVHVGVTDVGAGAKTTMGLIAAEALGVPLSKVEVVWGDTDRCPYSVGESGSRTTIMTGYAVVEAARDLKKQIAEKGLPKGDDVLIASATPNPTVQGKVRSTFGAHFVEVEVDTELGRVRVTKYLAVHDCGRIMNPLTAREPDQGRRDHGHRHGAARGPALRPAQRQRRCTAGYYGARVRDASRRAGDRGHLHRVRRRLRAVRREEHGRVEQGAGAGGGRPTPSSTRSAAA